MDVLVPFAAHEPKTRLADVFDEDERAALSREMLADVLDAVRNAGGEPTVVATAPIELPARTVVDDRPLTDAVNARLEPPIAIVMADLALATPAALRALFAADSDVAIAPGLGGGTNALVVHHPEFYVDYHGASFRAHREIAAEIGAEVETVDSFRLAVDVDEPSDLAEVLLHADGRSAAWLRRAGVRLVVEDGRVRTSRR